MKIGILGAGNVGSRLAHLARDAGHDVMIGSRSGETSFEQAIAHGEVVIIAIHYTAVASALGPLAEKLSGKLVVDATNPLNENWSPLLLGQENSAAEEISRLFAEATIVKAFNTVFADVMDADRLNRDGHKITAFVAGDDSHAVEKISELAASMGFAPIKINKMAAARNLEAIAHLNIELALGQGGGTNAAFLYHRA